MMQELMSIRFVLRPRKTNRIPGWLGQAAHGFFLRTLQSIHPGLSEIIHSQQTGIVPFTVNNPGGVDMRQPMIDIRPSKRLVLRYTALHPHMSMLILNGMIPMWSKTGFDLHDQPFFIEDMTVDEEENIWAGMNSYYDLLSRAGTNSIIKMDFTTPTAFKSKGQFLRLPEPRAVFGSLLRRWNAFAPVCMPEEMLDDIENVVVVDKHDIHTASARIKGRITQKGFVGKVSFRVQSESLLLCQYLNALALFAKYSGVGIRTGIGMGQAKVA